QSISIYLFVYMTISLDLSFTAHYSQITSFFFQAEDGIRDRNVTGVQTCALPISRRRQRRGRIGRRRPRPPHRPRRHPHGHPDAGPQRPRRHPRGLLDARRPPGIVMLTTFDADEYVFSALRAGASGFLLKDATAEDLITAVRVVAGGDSLLAPSVTRRLIAEYVAGPTVVKDTAVLGQLTDREIDVMRLVAKGHANAEVAKQLFLAEQ